MTATREQRGAYRQYCTFCEQACGWTDDIGLQYDVGECCQGLPEPWSLGANGLYGTDDSIRDLPGREDDYDEDEDDAEECTCWDCRFEICDLETDEIDDLDPEDLADYNRNRERRGLTQVTQRLDL